MADLQKILDAASFAAAKHTGQTRKDGVQPYVNHPLEVASLVADVGQVDDTDIIAAAILHDVIEDCDVTFDELAERFGNSVAQYVRELTDDKSLPKAERKSLQIQYAPHLSHGAKTVKLADKISNIRDVTQHPPAGWSIERRREYVDWGERVVAGLRGANVALEELFDQTAAEAREKIV
jgi:guanosine-3',5'-bis(diphosphate) 3'-pyrophosphohydrolase